MNNIITDLLTSIDTFTNGKLTKKEKEYINTALRIAYTDGRLDVQFGKPNFLISEQMAEVLPAQVQDFD